MTSPASLYERLGGIYPLAGAIDILVDRLFANVAVNANEAVRAHHGNLANAAGYKFLIAAWSIEAGGDRLLSRSTSYSSLLKPTTIRRSHKCARCIATKIRGLMA